MSQLLRFDGVEWVSPAVSRDDGTALIDAELKSVDDQGQWESVLTSELYAEGAEPEPWVEGYLLIGGGASDASRSKEADHLFLWAKSDHTSTYATEVAWVTDQLVDLGPWSTLHIEWAKEDVGLGTKRAVLVASTDQQSSYTVYDERLIETEDAFARREQTLDISGLSGSYYIRVHVRVAGFSGSGPHWEATVRSYNIWVSG